MEKINTIRKTFGQSVSILTTSQMSIIKGGATLSPTIASLDTSTVSTTTTVGPISATTDDKRRDRPGGGISTH